MKMSTTTDKEYQEAVHQALERCQFIEETLRAYIESAVETAKIELAPHFPVRFTTTDLSTLSLGRLVSIFSRLSADGPLNASLKAITKDRNFVAHRSLLFTLGKSADSTRMSEAIHEMRQIEQRARNIHGNLLDVRYAMLKSLARVRRCKRKPSEGEAQPTI